jgi:glutamyl-tRNA synthetase
MNGEYIRALSSGEFIQQSAPWVRPWSTAWRPSDREPPWREDQFSGLTYERVAPFIQERVATFGEIPAMVEFFFLDEPRFDEASFTKVIGNDPAGQAVLEASIHAFEVLATWDSTALHETVAAVGEENGLVLRKAQAPIRWAVTGTLVGPPLFESLEVLGRETTIRRLREALAKSA